MKFNLDQSHRQFLSDKLGDLANIIAAALVFGQFISNQPFNIQTFLIGLTFSVITYFIAYRIIKKSYD